MAGATGFAANAVTFAATTATVAPTAASPASSWPLLPQRHRCHHTEAHRRGRRRCLQGRAAAEKAKEALAPALRTIGQDGFTDLGNILASAVVRGFMHAGRGRVGRASPAERRGLRGRALPPAAASVGAPAPPRRPRRPCSTSCPRRRPWPHMFCKAVSWHRGE